MAKQFGRPLAMEGLDENIGDSVLHYLREIESFASKITVQGGLRLRGDFEILVPAVGLNDVD